MKALIRLQMHMLGLAFVSGMLYKSPFLALTIIIMIV